MVGSFFIQGDRIYLPCAVSAQTITKPVWAILIFGAHGFRTYVQFKHELKRMALHMVNGSALQKSSVN